MFRQRFAALLFLLAGAQAADPQFGVWGYFCQSDSASMSMAGSEACWRLGPGPQTSPDQRGWLMQIKWADIEPQSGTFDFAALDANLTAAVAKGYDIMIMLEIVKGHNATTPQWLYDELGVPCVRFNGGGSDGMAANGNGYAPYYLDQRFQDAYARTARALALHLQALPTALAAKVIAVQAAFGITGDDRPWDGIPVDPQYIISDAEWANYTRTFALDVYCDAYRNSTIGLTVNLNNPGVGQQDSAWFLRACSGMRGAKWQKNGIVSHGYQLNGDAQLYAHDRPFLWQVQPWGDYGRTRGELAVEPSPFPGKYGNWAESPWWSLHANAGWALTYGLDVWNLYALFIENKTFAPTMELFNRYAGRKDPATAGGAFLMLRDGLDSADFERFPAERYGGDSRPTDCTYNRTLYPSGGCSCTASVGPVCCRNASRGLAIAQAHAARGARQEKPSEATGKSVKQKKGSALNDVGCQIWPGNFGVHMTQLQASQTSVGYWRVGDPLGGSPYGRFARGSDNTNGMSIMYFALDRRLFGGLPLNATAASPTPQSQQAVELRIVYFDSGRGPGGGHANGAAFRAKYDAQSTVGQELPVVELTGSDTWKEAVYTLTDARFGGGENKGADFSLHLDECGNSPCADVVIAEVEVRQSLSLP